MTIVSLNHVDSSSTATTGGKGANLGELIKLGFPVPGGFVICADEYESLIKALDLPRNDQFSEEVLDRVRDQMMTAPLSSNLAGRIRQAHEKFAAGRQTVYAVRSSATAEDLSDASFAGQHDTYYYVEPEDVLTMVRKCWASLWSDAAVSYRESQGMEHRSVSMAVVIQKMVQSEVSGITFTADPLSGSDSVIVTEASWGMGAALVDGRVSPDQYLVDKSTGRLTSIKISDKKFMVPASLGEKQSSRLIEVPVERRLAETLSDNQIEQISKLALNAENHFACPQDLEWSIEGDEIYFLQSRPITILGEADPDVPEGKYILFKPLVENFTEPLKPLTLDLLDDLIPVLTIIYGRAYVNFNIFKWLIPFKLSDEDKARMAYLSDPEQAELRISPFRLMGLGLMLAMNYLVMAVFNRRTAAMPDDFMHTYRQRCHEIETDETINPKNALLHLFARFQFFEPAGNMVMMANLVSARYMITIRVLDELLKRWCPNLQNDSASLLVAGNEGVLSTEMGHEILKLANLARSLPSVNDAILNKPLEDAFETLSSLENGDGFLAELNHFLARHGHRGLKEFELSSTRWDEDPSQLLGMIRNYLNVDTETVDPEEAARKQRAKIQQQVDAKIGSLPFEKFFRIRTTIVNQLMNETRYYMKLQENSRFYHIMGFYVVRKKILAIEHALLSQGRLKCKDDIFYLHWQEVSDLKHGDLAWSDVEEIIRSRRMEHIRLTKLVPPKTIGIDIDDPVPTSGATLSGQGASPGSVEGVARVVMDPATGSNIQPGEILIAPYTDPAWTPLFLTVNAAVVEVGSYLSHAGTIAREYGMPCVVDVTNCTNRITTGMRIRVDGTNGSVTLLEEHGDA